MDNSLVPAPMAGDQDKFLCKQGAAVKWAEADRDNEFLSAKGSWIKGNNDDQFLQGNAGYGKMGLFPTAEEFTKMNWIEIENLAPIVKANPLAYQFMIGWTHDVVFGEPINKTVTHEIVDICHTDWGNNHTFVFMPKEEIPVMEYYASGARSQSTYTAATYYQKMQPGGEFWNALPEDLIPLMKECNIKILSSSEILPYGSQQYWVAKEPVQTLVQKWFIPSVVEVGCVNSAAEIYNKEGTILKKFSPDDDASRIRYCNGAIHAWWLRSLCRWVTSASNIVGYFSVMGAILHNGKLQTQPGSSYNVKQAVCPIFCI